MISTIFRTAVIYVCVILAIRIMGKRQISDMQPSELVITILISEIAAIPLQDASTPLLNGILAIFILVICEIVLSVLSLKIPKVRQAVSGNAIIIIKNGTIDQKAMKKVRMTVTELMELMRSKDVFDISQIDFAILEVNGELNIMLKNEYAPAVKRDISDKVASSSLPLAVICDGKPMQSAIDTVGTTQDKILSVLNSKNIKPSDVFLMTLDSQGNNNVILKDNTK